MKIKQCVFFFKPVKLQILMIPVDIQLQAVVDAG